MDSLTRLCNTEDELDKTAAQRAVYNATRVIVAWDDLKVCLQYFRFACAKWGTCSPTNKDVEDYLKRNNINPAFAQPFAPKFPAVLNPPLIQPRVLRQETTPVFGNPFSSVAKRIGAVIQELSEISIVDPYSKKMLSDVIIAREFDVLYKDAMPFNCDSFLEKVEAVYNDVHLLSQFLDVLDLLHRLAVIYTYAHFVTFCADIDLGRLFALVQKNSEAWDVVSTECGNLHIAAVEGPCHDHVQEIIVKFKELGHEWVASTQHSRSSN